MVRLKALVVLGGGGHTRELIELLLKLDFSYEFVFSSREKMLSRLPSGRVYKVPCLREIDESMLNAAISLLPSFLAAFRRVSKTRAKVILTSGPAISIPFLLAAKLFGKKIIFIENLARVYSPSKTGRIAYRLADLFFIQWPELKKVYPGSIYAGRLL